METSDDMWMGGPVSIFKPDERERRIGK